jgi:hypothetical protein
MYACAGGRIEKKRDSGCGRGYNIVVVSWSSSSSVDVVVVVVVVADGDTVDGGPGSLWGFPARAHTGAGWYLLAGLGCYASVAAAKHRRRRDFFAESTLPGFD